MLQDAAPAPHTPSPAPPGIPPRHWKESHSPDESPNGSARSGNNPRSKHVLFPSFCFSPCFYFLSTCFLYPIFSPFYPLTGSLLQIRRPFWSFPKKSFHFELNLPVKTTPLVDVPTKILYSGYVILKNDAARGIYLWIIMLPSVPR